MLGLTIRLVAAALLPAAHGTALADKPPRHRPSTQAMQQAHTLRVLQHIPVHLFPAALFGSELTQQAKVLVRLFGNPCAPRGLVLVLPCDRRRLLQIAYQHVRPPPRPEIGPRPLYPPI